MGVAVNLKTHIKIKRFKTEKEYKFFDSEVLMNINEALTQVTQLGILLAVLKYFGIFSLIRDFHNRTKYSSQDWPEDEVAGNPDGYDEFYLGKSDPTAIEASTLANYYPGDDDLFNPSNFVMSNGLYEAKSYDGFEARLYNVETGVEEPC